MRELIYSVPLALQEVVQRSEEFWKKQNNCTISASEMPEDKTSQWRLIITRGWTASSWSETYCMDFFSLLEYDTTTMVKIKIELFGSSRSLWKGASDILVLWAQDVGTKPIDFGTHQLVIRYLMVTILAIFVIIIFWSFWGGRIYRNYNNHCPDCH